MNNKESSSRVAGRLAVFSTLAALCALLAEYILISQDMVDYFGFVGFLLVAAVCLWAGFYMFARQYQAAWFDQVTDRNRELQLQALFSTLNPWPVLRFDRYGQLISKNSCAKTFFYNSDSADGSQRSVFDFFPELTKESWQDVVFKEHPLELEHDRSGYWLCFFFRAHLQLGVINVYGYDVTRYKRLQQQAVQKQTHSKQSALRTNQLLHDMFRSLHGPAKALQEVVSPSDGRQKINMGKQVEADIQSMVETVFRLEDIAELESGQLKLQSHSFDCRFMFEKLMNVMAKKAFANNGELILDCDFACYDVVMTDGRRLQQALDALLRFALLQSKNGIVLVKARWISDVGLSDASALDHSIGYEENASRMALRLSVHDSGIIDENISRILDESLEPEQVSSQLDLSGVDLNIRFLASLAPLVGGCVRAQASALGGHELTLDWPVEISQAQKGQVPDLPLSHLHVFIFDEVALSCEAVARTLSRAGASVDYCSSRDVMLNQIIESTPDVLIYSERRDHNLDQDLLKEVKNITGKQIALCLLSHLGENMNNPQFDNLNVESIITKPVRSRLLIQGVEHAWNTVQRAGEFEDPDSKSLEARLSKEDQTIEIDAEIDDTQQLASASSDSPRLETSKALLDLVNATQPREVQVLGAGRSSVLVVDDDMVVLHLVSDLLTEMGVDVEVAESAARALSLMTRFDFDLVIMDVRMPEMSGFEATQEIRATYGENIPIIALTASNEPADRAKALQMGMNDYLVKPVDRDTFAQRLSRWISLPNLNFSQLAEQVMQKIDEDTPLIQVREAIRLLSQDTTIFTRSLLRFYGRFSAESNKIESLFVEKDRDHIIKRLHGLRGGAANIGAYQLRDQIFAAEKILRQEGINEESGRVIHELVDLLRRVMAEASTLLLHFLDEDNIQKNQTSSTSLENDLDRIKGAVDHLSNNIKQNLEQNKVPDVVQKSTQDKQ